MANRNNIQINYEQRMIFKNPESSIYIYKNQEDFENNEGAAALAYFKSKQELKSKMIERYKNNFRASVKLSDKTIQYLNYAEDNEFDVLANAIDRAVQESLSGIVNSINAQIILDYRASVKNAFIESLDDINKIDKALQGISEAAEFVFKGKNLNALSVAINSSKDKSGRYNLKKLNASLRKALEPPPDRTIVTGVTDSLINSAIASLAALTAKISANEPLTIQNIEGYIKNIFNTGFGEGLINRAIAFQTEKAVEEVDSHLSSIGFIKQSDTGSSEQYEILQNSAYKSNIQTDNFKLNIDEDENSATIDLGILAKTYSSYHGGSSFSIRAFSNQNFSQVLSTIFGDGKFFAYNTISNLSEGNSIYREMKQAIVMAFADILLSGSGINRGFSQYIVINGTFYPIYTILKTITQLDAENQDILRITLSGETAVKNIRSAYAGGANNRLKAWQRTKKQIAVLDDLIMNGYFYPNRLLGKIIL